MRTQRTLMIMALVLSGCADADDLSREATPSGVSTLNAPYDAVYDMVLFTAAEGGLLTVSEDRASGDIRLSSGSYDTDGAPCHGNLLGLFLTREGERTRVQVQERMGRVLGVGCRHMAPIFMSRLSARVYSQFGAGASAGAARGPQSGSGYFITAAGHLITNAHVVEGCTREFTLSGPSWLPQNSRFRIINVDPANDLALLQLIDRRADRYVSFRSSTPQLGESVVVLGYPLQPLLARELNATTGTVSSLAGIENDRRRLQISAPTQPGNSGGPVVDQSGSVIGTVVSGLNADIVRSENVNFAIHNVIVRAFLQLNQIEPELAADGSDKPVTELAAGARDCVVSVGCVVGGGEQAGR